jgi:hypothetical protein
MLAACSGFRRPRLPSCALSDSPTLPNGALATPPPPHPSPLPPKERENPELLIKSPSRRRRIAEGAGRKEADVSQLCTEFAAMRVQMQTMSKMMKMGVPGARTPRAARGRAARRLALHGTPAWAPACRVEPPDRWPASHPGAHPTLTPPRLLPPPPLPTFPLTLTPSAGPPPSLPPQASLTRH